MDRYGQMVAVSGIIPTGQQDALTSASPAISPAPAQTVARLIGVSDTTTLPGEPFPGLGRVLPGSGEVSTGAGQVPPVPGGFSPGPGRCSLGPAEVPPRSARVLPVAGGSSPVPGRGSPGPTEVPPRSARVPPVAGGFSPVPGRSSPVGGGVSPEAGGFPPHASKTPISCNLCQKLAQKAPPGRFCPAKSPKNRHYEKSLLEFRESRRCLGEPQPSLGQPVLRTGARRSWLYPFSSRPTCNHNPIKT